MTFDNAKKSMKDGYELPIIILGKLKKLTNVNSEFPERKPVFTLELNNEQLEPLKLVIKQIYSKCYKDLTPDYLPFDGENLVVKAPVNVLMY
jgi:hypothetical protein